MLTVVTVRFRKALSRRKINAKTSLCISVMSSTWPRGIAFALGRVPSPEDHRPGYAPRECKTDDAEHCRRFCFCAVYNKSYRKQDSRNDRSCQCTCIHGPFLLFPAAAAPAEKALRKLSAEQAYPIMYSPQPAAFITADAMTSRMIALAVHAAAALAAALPSKALLFADNKKNTSR